MAADNEVRLISKAIRDRELLPLIERGVQPDWFFDDTCKDVYSWALGHWNKYGECPSMVTAKDNFPTMRNLKVEDSLEYLLDQLVLSRKRDHTVELLQDAVALVSDDNNFEAALALLRSRLAVIDNEGHSSTTDVDVTQTTVDRLATYAELRNVPGGLLGYSTGFPTIDRATDGLQGGQLIVLVAQPKAGKSTIVLNISKHIHAQGHVVLVVSFEMTNVEQEMRLDAMIAEVSAARLRTGRLNLDEQVRLSRKLKEFSRRDEFWLTQDMASATVSGIAAKIEKYKPDAVFIDGVYLMTDEISGEQNTPQALTNITRNMKKLAMRTDVPILISTQTLEWKMSKRKISSNSIGYSSSFAQDANVILGLEHVAGDDGENDDLQRRLRVVLGRNNPGVGVNVLFDWENSRFVETDTVEEDAA